MKGDFFFCFNHDYINALVRNFAHIGASNWSAAWAGVVWTCPREALLCCMYSWQSASES